MLWPWQCDRVCPDISVTPDTSLMVVSGDRTVTAECERAVDSDTGAEVWGGDTRLRHRHTLLLSCTDIFLDSEDADSFSGVDTLSRPLTQASHYTNFTQVLTVLMAHC